MRIFSRIPLYLGLSIFIVAVLFSAIKVSQQGQLANLHSKAAIESVSLALHFTSPDQISLTVSSEKEVAGIDILLRYDPDQIEILPSSLVSATEFTTSGGIVDEATSTFAFSAVVNSDKVKSGIVATFKVKPKESQIKSSSLDFVTGEGNTAVFAQDNTSDILKSTQGITINF